MKLKFSSRNGLSLVEAMVIIAVILLLGALLLPALAKNNARPKRISCVSYLKQIGLGVRLFMDDHQKQYPWKVPISANGSLEFANSPQVFRHFLVLSNELVTPKILACPADTQRKMAPDFAKLSNGNVSYFVNFDADESDPQRLLSGDRNITGGSPSNGFVRTFTTKTEAGWTTELHNQAGNVGLADGSVQQVNGKGLNDQLKAQSVAVIRLLIP